MCNQFESTHHYGSQGTRFPRNKNKIEYVYIETTEHGQECSQTQAQTQGSGNNHGCSCAIGMQLCLLYNANTAI